MALQQIVIAKETFIQGSFIDQSLTPGCPEFMRNVVGQASFLYPNKFLPILEGVSVEKSKVR